MSEAMRQGAPPVPPRAAGPRLLMFAPAYPPLGNPEAIVNGKLALALGGAGWEVDVVSRDLARESGYNYGTSWEEPWLALREAVRVVRYPRAGSVARLVDTLRAALRTGHLVPGCRWSAHAAAIGIQRHRAAPYDAVLSRSGPESAHLAALMFARRTGVRWIANWNDPCREKMPPPYGGGPDAPVGRRYARFLRQVALTADVHVFPSARQRSYMCRYLGSRAAARAVCIPHAGLLSRERFAVPASGPFTICHAGRLTPERRPEVLLDGLAMFAGGSHGSASLRLRLIGLEDVGLLTLARRRGLGEMIVAEGPMGYRETLAALSKSHVALLVEASCPEGIFLPSKIVDYVQVGRPILAVSPAVGTVADLLARHGGGIAVSGDSPAAVAQGLSRLHSAWREGRLESDFGSTRLWPLFEPGLITRRYRELVANECPVALDREWSTAT